MIPVKFSYFRIIFGKSGQGRCLSGLPSKCRELLSYLSIHFFADKELQFATAALQPAFIPAGRTIIWEFDRNKDQANDHEHFSNTATNTLFNVLKCLSLNNIIKNIYFTYYAGEVEIADKNDDNSNTTHVLNHLLSTSGDSCGHHSSRDWFFCDPIPEKIHAASLHPDSSKPTSFEVEQRGRLFKPSILHKRVDRWMYFLFHHQNDRISPPGYIHVYQRDFTGDPPGSVIRAGPS
ncbi:MAG: hypothetical protein PHD25_03265 [Bacteroidales bacterium]|nr:hypothetical protein [Bacteroidales bacterium]